MLFSRTLGRLGPPTVVLLAASMATAQSQPPATRPPAVKPTAAGPPVQGPPRETILLSEAPGLKLFYRPQPFMGGLARLFQEAPRDAPLAKKDWPVARLETSKPFSVDKTRLEPGNYALVLIPRRAGVAMHLQFRSIPPGEFFKPGTIVQVPEGPTVAQAPLEGRFEGTSRQGLIVDVERREGGQTAIVFRYGDWVATALLAS